MAVRLESLSNRRAIIDRRDIAGRLDEIEGKDTAALRREATAILKAALEHGRAEIAARLAAAPTRGTDAATGYAFLTDQILRLVFDFTTGRLYPLNNPTAGERLTLMAVGGYGRAEMALHSDVDIAFLTPWKQTGWAEQVIESMLYLLWDLGLKVGHSSRSLDDMVRMAKSDLTIRTAMLEGRFVWGDEALYDEASARFDREVVAGTARAFVAEKLAERDERHRRMGDSRYVVEPNLKEGKGGLRDLHTLFWIGKYVNRVRSVPELVDTGLLTPDELRQFQKAENFLWAVRCHLHILTNRAEDRLTFDVQPDIARRMRYADRPGRSAVERFMQHYFLTAKRVGDLTGVFLAHLDEEFAARGRRFALPRLRRKPRKLEGFAFDRGRLTTPHDDFFVQDPVRLLQMFALADKYELEIHPVAMRQAGRDARLIDNRVRRDPRANAYFLDVLTSRRNPETVLRWMNEAGVFGRFVPDFGRVVAQMQFDMYHHFTVDEHTIRAIGLLSAIEKGELDEDHPLASLIMRQLVSRRALYVAVLLHDIAKGRGGDHSELGAEVALKLCPRLGLTAAETELVAWLVRWHLLMSATAFKRDLADFKTILDFVEAVQSPERLRLLLVLTVVDIRAVGPGVWNSWKRQLLSDLYEAAEEVLRLGHKQRGRKERVEAKQAAVRDRLGWPADRFDAMVKRLPEAYWVAEGVDVIERNMRLIHDADAGDRPLSIGAVADPERGATLVTIYAADHPGLFYRIAGAIHLAGGSIIDARIHTTRDGMAVDNILVQDPFGRPFDEEDRLRRLESMIDDALANRSRIADRLAAKPLPRARAEAFPIEPVVLIDNRASNRYTVVEINARDRPALLNALAHALFQSKVTIHSAHIATYGERAVDVFYVTDLTGDKVTGATRLKALERRLLEAAGGEVLEPA
ncbi:MULTISPECIES: [protein-PII] uridylyltransferase [Sphingomonadales]|uniref:Bifunctional uridylyltransferase/uridylyl-removing enzyme n=2 Tax=Edaphosphingomonas TaxID=3423724 RepID=A0A2T4HP39_9SPHN|nr:MULTISPECIES: [protein-PII] uridylyltransferase [Sphingomonas]AGH49316.1 PII uridylyl-transferase [Sphingomonas sp. MM-1]MDX3885895.1 [protein-PII] uridylyltransferase [Sphingomonas sp.]OHT21953.1 Bifunctional uridylyltransferase/uridylyl-removing enzyme [Sphingomonas haloaromaticamans]PTD17562.1 [protein-PII] uridylyltransferase [Sphingomonas fennica]